MTLETQLGVQEISLTSGTGPYELNGPTPDHWTFRDTVQDGTEVTYEAHDGARSEYGLGRFEAPSTLHRVQIINSSEGNQPINWPESGQSIISLIIDNSGQLLPVGGECAQALIKFSDLDFAASWQWRPYPIAMWIDGLPGANRQIRLAITEPVWFDRNFPNSVAIADIPPTRDISIEINRITSQNFKFRFGTLTFRNGFRIGQWFTWAGDQLLNAGDRIEFLFPADASTLADIAITARGIILCGDLFDTPLPPVPIQPPPFDVGAVYFDNATYLWNFPTDIADSPVGTLSYWMYVDNFRFLRILNWNPADLTNVMLTNNNLTATVIADAGGVRTNESLFVTGKQYWEYTFTTASTTAIGCGLSLATASLTNPTAGSILVTRAAGDITINGSATGSSLGAIPSGSSICVAVDFNTLRIWFRVAPLGPWNGSGTADPATGTGGISISSVSGPLFPMMVGQSGDVVTANFGTTAFAGMMPFSGFDTPWPFTAPIDDGDLHSGNVYSIMAGATSGHGVTLEMWQARNRTSGPNLVPVLTITNVSSSNPAIITLSHPHDILEGCFVFAFAFNQTGWNFGFSGNRMRVLSVTSTTVTVDFNTTGLPAYVPSSNSGAMLQPLHATNIYFVDLVKDKFVEVHSMRSLPARTWIHVIRSWDLNHAPGSKISLHYFNDDEVAITQMQDLSTTPMNVSYTISAADDFWDDITVWNIGGVDSGYSPWDYGGMSCHLAEFWFAPGQFLDIADPAVRAKFRNPSTGKPVSLGEDGSEPTGTAPAIYLHTPKTVTDVYQYMRLPLRFVNMWDNDIFSNSGTLANGITTSSKLVFSCWSWGDFGLEFSGWGYNVDIYFDSVWHTVTLYGADSSQKFEFEFTYDFRPSGVRNVRFAIDTNHPIGSKVVQVYVDNTPVSVTITTDNTNNLQTNWVDDNEFDLNAIGFIAAVWIGPNQFFDISEQFIDEAGNPVKIGDSGELPSGMAPSFFFNIVGSQPAGEFANNRGSGGSTTTDYPEEFRLVPSGAAFLKNRAGGEDLHFNGYGDLPLAPTNPWDVIAPPSGPIVPPIIPPATGPNPTGTGSAFARATASGVSA